MATVACVLILVMAVSGCSKCVNTNAAKNRGTIAVDPTYWTVEVESIVQNYDLLITSIRVVSPHQANLVVTAEGNTRDSILLTENQQGIYEGTIIICASLFEDKSLFEDRPESITAKAWYQLKSSHGLSLSGTTVGTGDSQKLSEIVTVHASNGSHAIGESVPFATLGKRKFELSVR